MKYDIHIGMCNLYRDDSYNYFLPNALITLSFLISTWTAEPVSNSSRKQRITFFYWLATPNEVKSSCSSSPRQSHETSHSGSEIIYFHCLQKYGKSVCYEKRQYWNTIHWLLLISVCEILSPQGHLEGHLCNASMPFKGFQYISATCKQGLWSPRSGFKLPGNSLVFTISPRPTTHFGLCELPCDPPAKPIRLWFSLTLLTPSFFLKRLSSPTFHTLLYISNPNLFFKAYLKCHLPHKIIHDGHRWR